MQEQQMLMMPPPYKSPPMGAQQPSTPTHPIMNSPTINRSPHYGLPTENGTTSEDSDGKFKHHAIASELSAYI